MCEFNECCVYLSFGNASFIICAVAWDELIWIINIMNMQFSGSLNIIQKILHVILICQTKKYTFYCMRLSKWNKFFALNSCHFDLYRISKHKDQFNDCVGKHTTWILKKKKKTFKSRVTTIQFSFHKVTIKFFNCNYRFRQISSMCGRHSKMICACLDRWNRYFIAETGFVCHIAFSYFGESMSYMHRKNAS